MTERQPKASPTPEDVQDDMRDTRTHLGAGMRALGGGVAGYAHDAADALGDTCREAMNALHGARHAAEDGAAFARRALDVRRRPWAVVGLAVGLGFASGLLLARRR